LQTLELCCALAAHSWDADSSVNNMSCYCFTI
jgi:hypothetical protein